jgi:putative DNA primase/helicase
MTALQSQLCAPLKLEEIAAAQNGNKNGGHEKSAKTPIIPVPADAPPCNFAMPDLGGKPAKLYPYHQADGQLIGYVARWDSINPATREREKKILPLCYCDIGNGKKAWRSAGMPTPRHLYSLPEILARKNVPIIIAEGEKTADAAKILFPDYVATTPMHGAKSPHKTDWSAVRGRHVIIATDNDAAGGKFGDAVYDLCIAAGADSVFHLPAQAVGKRRPVINGFEPCGRDVPQGYDLADALDEDWTFQDMERFLKFAPLTPYIKESELSDLNEKTGSNFRLTPNGVEHAKPVKDKDGTATIEWTWFCSYLAITHQTRDGQACNWGCVCVIIDNDGRRKEYVLPMSALAGDGVAYREELLSLGLRLAPNGKQLLHSYITMANPKARAVCVKKTGWHNGCYVLPNRVYGQVSGERIVLQNFGADRQNTAKGSLIEWQNGVGALCENNSRLIFAVCVSLSGIMLEPLGEENFGFHLEGSSSIGKTTVMHVSVSVWGSPIQSWRTTDNAAEGLARQANDGFLALDELSQADGTAADAMAYMLGNGAGKARSRRDGAAKPVELFRLSFLSSGETGLASKVQEGGRHTKAGQTVRFIEIQADAGKSFGAFDDLHGFEDGNLFSSELKHLAGQNTGVVADAFLTMLCANRDAVIKSLIDARKCWVAEHVPADVDGQVHRVGHKFALVAAVGELAIASRILPWSAGGAERACAGLFKDWLKARGGTKGHEVKDAERRLRAFIAEHGGARFEPAWLDRASDPHDRKTINRAGFKRMTDAGAWEYFILPSVFEKEVIASLNKTLVKEHLASMGLILRDAAGKYTPSIRVPGHGQMRLYHVPSTILSVEDSHADA